MSEPGERRSGPLTCLVALVTGAVAVAGVGAWWWGRGRFASAAGSLMASGDAAELARWASPTGWSRSALPASIQALREDPSRARGVVRALLDSPDPARRVAGWNLVLTAWQLDRTQGGMHSSFLRPRTPLDHPLLAEATRQRFARDLGTPDPALRQAALRVLRRLLDDGDPEWLAWSYGVLAPLAAAPERETRNVAVPLLVEVAHGLARWLTPKEREAQLAQLRFDLRPALRRDMGALLEHTLVLSQNGTRGVESAGLYAQFLGAGSGPNVRRNAGALVAEAFLALGLMDRETFERLSADQGLRERYLLRHMDVFRKALQAKGWPFQAQRK